MRLRRTEVLGSEWPREAHIQDALERMTANMDRMGSLVIRRRQTGDDARATFNRP